MNTPPRLTEFNPAHLRDEDIYERRITYPTYPDDIDDPEVRADDISRITANRMLRFKCAVFGQFWFRWKHEYVTLLREFHKRRGGEGNDEVLPCDH